MKTILLTSAMLLVMTISFQAKATNVYVAPKNNVNTVEFQQVIPPRATQVIAAKGEYSVVRCERAKLKELQSYDKAVGVEYCYFVVIGNQILTVVNQTNKAMIAKNFAYNTH